EDFDLEAGETVPCPMCRKGVEPKTCAFYQCVWRYVGMKEGTPKSSSWAKVTEKYHRFSEKKAVKWDHLLIQARPLVVLNSVKLASPSKVCIDYMYPECTICIEDIEERQRTKVLGCGHHFHDVCIHAWAKGSSKVVCPNCRKQCAMP
ncbi:unnamed protein product, partial [Hapterophycus canaliculatus]